jgi:hypothetical protein
MGRLSTPLEKSVVKKIRDYLDKQPNTYHFVKEAKNIRGIPDLIVCKKGTFIALEVKRSAAELKKPGAKLQAYNIKKITEAGGFAYFIFPENMEEILSIINKL